MIKKDWKDVLRDDIDETVYKIMDTYANSKGQESNMTYDMKKVLRLFFRWFKTGDRLRKPYETECYELQGIRFSKPKSNIEREDLITEDDLKKLLGATMNLRNRAMIHVHYEAGTRAGELLSLRIRDVKFDQYGAVIHVVGKTGSRPIRLINSVPDLVNYLDKHPFKNEKDSPLWIMMQRDNLGKPMDSASTRGMLQSVATRAKLDKKIYLHLFRHSEATRTANFMTEAQMRKRHGWSNISKMPSRYVHLVDSDVEEAILNHHGIENKEKPKVKTTIKCKFCESFNDPGADLCVKCMNPLSLESALKKETSNQNEELVNLVKELQVKIERLEEKSVEKGHKGYKSK